MKGFKRRYVVGAAIGLSLVTVLTATVVAWRSQYVSSEVSGQIVDVRPAPQMRDNPIITDVLVWAGFTLDQALSLACSDNDWAIARIAEGNTREGVPALRPCLSASKAGMVRKGRFEPGKVQGATAARVSMMRKKRGKNVATVLHVDCPGGESVFAILVRKRPFLYGDPGPWKSYEGTEVAIKGGMSSYEVVIALYDSRAVNHSSEWPVPFDWSKVMPVLAKGS